MTTKKGALRATNLAVLTLGTLTALVLSFGTANAELVGHETDMMRLTDSTCNYNLVGANCSWTYCDVHDGHGGCSHYADKQCGLYVGLADVWCSGSGVPGAYGVLQAA